MEQPVASTSSDDEREAEALIQRTWRVAGAALGVAVVLLLIGVMFPLRSIGHVWNEQDVIECRASAFVEQVAASGGEPAEDAALRECIAHRRANRWGPWRAFGTADDHSRYNAADD